MEHLSKIIRVDENPMENEEEVDDDETSGNEPSDMDKLPTEVLMKLLSFLTEQQLVKLRLVNSRWNEICCLLLQKKSKNNHFSKLIVQLKKSRGKNYVECKTAIKRSVDAFIKCFAPSEAEIASGRRPCPFSRFKIEYLKYMNLSQICEFASTFGPHMKSVSVTIHEEDIPNFEKCWKLLLHFAPHIEHLEIIGYWSLDKVNLVDPIIKYISIFDPNFKAANPNPNPTDDTFLNNLKILDIKARPVGQFNGFIKELLDSAPKIQQVSCNKIDLYHNNELKNLEVWQQLGKDHLVKKMKLGSVSKSDIPLAELMKNLQLHKLEASCTPYSESMVKENEITSNNIYHAIKSSQETLSKLDLTDLTMESLNRCFRDISSLPNVRQLKVGINKSEEIANILHRLSQLCPNTTSLDLDSLHLKRNLSTVAPVLWTEFKGLRILHLSLTVDNEECHPSILDSAFTGYSQESIERIQTKLNQGKTLKKARRRESQNPSILDLKNLVELQLILDVDDVEWPELEEQVENSLLMEMLPEYLTKNPRLLEFSRTSEIDYGDDDDYDFNSDSDSQCYCNPETCMCLL